MQDDPPEDVEAIFDDFIDEVEYKWMKIRNDISVACGKGGLVISGGDWDETDENSVDLSEFDCDPDHSQAASIGDDPPEDAEDEFGNMLDDAPTTLPKSIRGGMMRFLIAACLVLSCGLCLAEDLPEDTNEIKTLTAEQAADLMANFLGHQLKLNGLTSIDKDVAAELAKLEGYRYLSLCGLTSIDKDVAQELSNFKGNELSLDGLTSIDKDVAEELAKIKGEALNLRGLTSLDKDVAQGLAKFDGWLSLNGLTSIDKDVAKELATFEGQLDLSGLISIDKDVAQELAKFKGGYLNLNGLTSINKDVLKILKLKRSIVLPEKYRDKKD